MFEGHDQALYELLAERRLVSPPQLEHALTEHRAGGKPLADVVLELGLLDKPALLRGVAAHCDADYAAEVPARLPDEALALLDGRLARTYGVAPLQADITSITLLATDPFDGHLAGDLAFALEREVRLAVADPERVAALIRQHYGDDVSLKEAAEELQFRFGGDEREELSETDLEEMAGQAPVIRYVNLVLHQAVRDQAADIHFEPFEHDFRIRCRIDGTLRELAAPPLALAKPVISRLKVLANLNIAERRVPQDGRIRLGFAGRAVDLRVATLPTQFGESVVLRVLDQSAVPLELTELGLPRPVEESVTRLVRRPHGIFLVTGPTGSGKTTTLYSCLRILNTPGTKILTVEDPVEYEMDGVMQVPVNLPAGLTFARALRSFLRQDPDVVMVGEIRDAETAQIAIQAALTGHLVLSTLHTNDAPGAVTRLIDMGVEPFLLASTLEAVLAQRLVRRICPECKTAGPPPAGLLHKFGLTGPEAAEPYYSGRGCAACQFTGYRGRTGLFELFEMNEDLRDLVVAGASLAQLRQRAAAQGMTSLREAGLRAVRAGETTLEEMARYV